MRRLDSTADPRSADGDEGTGRRRSGETVVQRGPSRKRRATTGEFGEAVDEPR